MGLISRSQKKFTLTIANGATTSDKFAAGGHVIFGLVVPSAFTGTSLTFSVSADDSTYQTLYDNTGTVVSLTVSTSRSFDLPTALAAWPYFKIISGSSEGAARSLVVVAKG